MGRFVTSLKTTGDRCLISLPCSPGSLRNLPEGNPARLIMHIFQSLYDNCKAENVKNGNAVFIHLTRILFRMFLWLREMTKVIAG